VRILIADDDTTSRLMLTRVIEGWGYDVVAVQDGAAAWDCITGEAPPTLAIVDWMMPELSGIELCRRIRAKVQSPIYVILLTSRNTTEDLVEGLHAGADDYLRKPFDPDELSARLHVGKRTLALIANIKHLAGLLPICSYCKRIRSDHNYWEQLESYITEHSGAQFSHGICPACLDKALNEFEAPAAAKGEG
jgi:sigma-B regulation protein RsbU (phosphoserine phosphatase)